MSSKDRAPSAQAPKTPQRPQTAPAHAQGTSSHPRRRHDNSHPSSGKSKTTNDQHDGKQSSTCTSTSGAAAGVVPPYLSDSTSFQNYAELLSKWSLLHHIVADEVDITPIEDRMEQEHEEAQRKARQEERDRDPDVRSVTSLEADNDDDYPPLDDVTKAQRVFAQLAPAPASSLEYATALLEDAAEVSGVDLPFLQQCQVYPSLLTGSGGGSTKAETKRSSKHHGQQTSSNSDDAHDDASDEDNEGRSESGDAEEETEEEAVERLIQAELVKGKLKDPKDRDIATQRVRQAQQFQRRSLLKVDLRCARTVFSSGSGGGGGSGSGSGKKPAMGSVGKEAYVRSDKALDGINQRLNRERTNFTKRVLKVVSDMRSMVQHRKAEIAHHLDLQEKERAERVAYYEEQERQRQLAHRAQCRLTKEKWAQQKETERQLKLEKRKQNRLQSELMKQMRNDSEAAARRKEDYWVCHAGELARKRGARQSLFHRTTDEANRKRAEADERRAEDEARRQESLRVKNIMDHEQAEERRQHRENMRKKAYATAAQREADRQKHLAEEAAWTQSKSNSSANHQLQEMKDKNHRYAVTQSHRDQVHSNNERIKQDDADTALAMLQTREELSRRHKEHHEHQMTLKRDYYKQQNRMRMALAEQHARAMATKAARDRARWEGRKEALESQDREIKQMKNKLRQDKERLAMQTTFLKLSQKKGDLKKLDQFIQALDSELEGDGERTDEMTV